MKEKNSTCQSCDLNLPHFDLYRYQVPYNQRDSRIVSLILASSQHLSFTSLRQYFFFCFDVASKVFLFFIGHCHYFFLCIFFLFYNFLHFYFMSLSSPVCLLCFIQMPSLVFLVIYYNFYHVFQLAFSYYFSMTIIFYKIRFSLVVVLSTIVYII